MITLKYEFIITRAVKNKFFGISEINVLYVLDYKK